MINSTEFLNIINYIFILFCYTLTKIYSLAIEFRIFIQIFFQVNPYYYPVRVIWLLTNPIFTMGRKLYPMFIGLDICPMVNLILLKKLSAFFHIYLVKYTKQGKLLSNLIKNSSVFNYKKYSNKILKNMPTNIKR